MAINPIRRPPFIVRNYVLRLTPIGTYMYDVVNIIEGIEGWSGGSINYKRGFLYPRGGGTHIEGLNTFVGDMSIRAFAGGYWPANVPIMGLFLQTTVSIFWGFDEDGKLIDVYVWKGMGW